MIYSSENLKVSNRGLERKSMKSLSTPNALGKMTIADINSIGRMNLKPKQ